ncbi:MAG TPA: hypothetical protein VGH71_07265, partial [Gammaproteobacteria bacterium]
MPVTLLIPGFLRAHQAAGRPRLPALERMLGRATASPTRHTHPYVASLFGLEDIAVAPFMRLADGGVADQAYWLRADPVHLAPDRDQLVLTPPTALHASREETQALAATFAATYGEEGWRLEFPHPQRGYLKAPRALDVITHDPEPFVGGPVLAAMPEGRDGQGLKRLMNETQMLFHTHPVNSLREDAGRPAINSLWFWGGGTLPPAPGRQSGRVVGSLLLLRGLAMWAGMSSTDLGNAAQVQEGDLIGLEADDLEDLERDWFAPLFSKVRAGAVRHLDIHLEGL